MVGPAAAALLLASCTEYGLNSPLTEVPPPPGPTSHPSAPSWGPHPVTHEECDGVPVASSGPAPGDTCNTVDFQGWDLAVEWEVATVPAYLLPMVVPGTADGPAIEYSYEPHGRSYVVELDGDDGSTRTSFAVGVIDSGDAPSFSRNGSGELAVAWLVPARGGEGNRLAWWSESEPPQTSEPFAFGAAARWLDVDADGVAEIASHNATVSADGTTIASIDEGVSYDWAMAAHGDFTGTGRMQIASAFGIWDAQTGDLTPWNGLSEYTLEAAAVMLDGEVALLGTDGSGAFRARPDGEVVWRLPLGVNETEGIAVGDVDGDGVPEMAVNTWAQLVLLDANGETRWSVPSANPEYGSVAMADLDADGAYEVIAVGNSGLRILDGATGTVLAADPSFDDDWLYASPAIADIDGDGSVEIVVNGRVRDTGEWVIRSYGAASGGWARTRPVWNELDYDVTTVQDDGQIAVWPIPNWESYNSFRAQPAHDGPHPDLTVIATDLCCAADTVYLAVQPENLGSVDALAGATVTLSTNDGTGWRTVAAQTLPEGIDAQTAAAGFAFEVLRADWGNLQVLQITGTDGDECDFVNDRVQVGLVCPP